MNEMQDNISNILNKKNLSFSGLARLIGEYESSLIAMIKGQRPFTDKVIKKLLPILEISQEEFESWIVADKYSKEVLKAAFVVKKNFPYKRKSILTTKIDSILQEKGMTRAAVAKQINYSQSGLNRMIIGQISMSKSVIERLSNTLDISANELKGWIVADKYFQKVLELAVKEYL